MAITGELVSRTVGWIAQWKEMIEDPSQKIGRPRQLYIEGDAPGLRADRKTQVVERAFGARRVHGRGRLPAYWRWKSRPLAGRPRINKYDRQPGDDEDASRRPVPQRLVSLCLRRQLEQAEELWLIWGTRCAIRRSAMSCNAMLCRPHRSAKRTTSWPAFIRIHVACTNMTHVGKTFALPNGGSERQLH